MKQNTTPNEKTQKDGKKNSKALKDRVHKHLNDKNDVITDEDMKNIKVGEDVVEDSEQAEEMAKALDKTKPTSPWKILSEEDK